MMAKINKFMSIPQVYRPWISYGNKRQRFINRKLSLAINAALFHPI